MEEIISGWNYDYILSQRQSEVEEAYRKQKENNKKLIKQIREVSRGLNDQKILHKIGRTKEELEGIIEDARSELRKDNTQFAVQKREDISSSHPVLLGPATLDSLLERVPDRLDYIKEGKFPFDNIFFEFMEPVERAIIGPNIEGTKLCGIQLIKNRVLSENIEGAYFLSGFYHMEGKGYSSVESTITNDTQSLLGGLIRIPSQNGAEVINFKRELDNFGNLKGLIYRKHKENFPHFTYILGEDSSVGSKEDNVAMELQTVRLNRLAVNIINYINAQNVRIVPAKRRVQTRKFRDSRRSGRKAVHEAEKPFHIIKIDSGIKEIKEEKGSNWTLQHRVYVMGHDRHYRDERGNIRKVIYIEPHVRGPENAPWRHHRHADRAAMIEREGKGIQDYLPKITKDNKVA
tara:strand:- start:311 stop:1522 length:1212 start_codon:yes stop_codon:yes gene_type:complete